MRNMSRSDGGAMYIKVAKTHTFSDVIRNAAAFANDSGQHRSTRHIRGGR